MWFCCSFRCDMLAVMWQSWSPASQCTDCKLGSKGPRLPVQETMPPILLTPNTQWANNLGKLGKQLKIDQFVCFCILRGSSWGLLNMLKILSWSPLRFSIIGKPIVRTYVFCHFGVSLSLSLSLFGVPSLSTFWCTSFRLLAEAFGRPEPEQVERVSAKTQKRFRKN